MSRPFLLMLLCSCASSPQPPMPSELVAKSMVDTEPTAVQPGPMTSGRYVGSVTVIEAPTQCSGGAVPTWDLLGQPEPMVDQLIVLPWQGAPEEASVSMLVSIRPLEAGEWIDMSPTLPGCWLLVHPDFLVQANASRTTAAWPVLWHSAGAGQVRWWSCPPELAMFTYHLQLVVVDAAGMRGSNGLVVKIGRAQ